MTKNSAVIDSFAWIEYFKGSNKGHQAASYIEGGNGVTPIIVVAELSAYYAREQINSWGADFQFIESQTALAELPVTVARIAGQTRQKMRKERSNFGLIDAIIYELALFLKATVVTGDPHFDGLPSTIFLK